MDDTRLLKGNQAVAEALAQAGIGMATSYPGTPTSEILPNIIRLNKEHDLGIYTEFSINEKVAFETALAGAFSGIDSCVLMKQVGLNACADPFMTSVYYPVKGAMIVVVGDDPGPDTSPNEQDSRLFAITGKWPVFDPSSIEEIGEYTKKAVEISRKYRIPVMLRLTSVLCYSYETVSKAFQASKKEQLASFTDKYITSPQGHKALRKEHNKKFDALQSEVSPDMLKEFNSSEKSDVAIVTSGSVYPIILDSLAELEVQVPILKLGMVNPFPLEKVSEFTSKYKKVLVLEETDPVIELLIKDSIIYGRGNGFVPRGGALTLPVIKNILIRTLELNAPEEEVHTHDSIKLERSSEPVDLCPGCPHFFSFQGLKKAFPDAIFCGDIGCYTLAIKYGVTDTILSMGSSLGIANGLAHLSNISDSRPIVALIGDSTFFHSGIPPLIDIVHNKSNVIVVILDNSTTGMTGGQSTSSSLKKDDGNSASKVKIEDIVQACGIKNWIITNPRDKEEYMVDLEKANEFTNVKKNGASVVISRSPCLLY